MSMNGAFDYLLRQGNEIDGNERMKAVVDQFLLHYFEIRLIEYTFFPFDNKMLIFNLF